MTPPELEPRRCSLVLRDGRDLAWSEYGPVDGRPLLYLHGGNDCGLEAGWFAASLAAELRVIAPNRPGFGGSTFLADRRFADIVADTDALLDQLGIAELPAFGLSGGGSTLGLGGSIPARSARRRRCDPRE